MSATTDLFDAARAADPACVGCALIGAQTAQPGWVVVTRGDGVRVRVDGVSAGSAALAAVANLDLSASAQAARAAARDRARAAALVIDGAPDRVLIRGALKLIHGAFAEQAAWNAKVRQRLTLAGLGDPGAPPVVREWAALMAALTQLIAGGAGDPPAQPAPVPPP